MTVVLKRASRLPFAPIVAALFAIAAAVLVMAAPVWLLERTVNQIGLSSILPAAAPPLGMKARGLLALLALFGTGVVSWIVAMPLAKVLSRPTRRRGFDVQPFEDHAPAAITAPAAAEPARAPIFATRDLGPPFMSQEALDLAPVSFNDAQAPATEAPASETQALEAEEAPLTLGADWLADGLPFAADRVDETVEPGAPVLHTAPAAAYQIDTRQDYADLPGLELEAGDEVDDFSHADAPFAMPIAEQPYDFPPATTVPSVPVAAPADNGQETIAELIERLEQGLDQLTKSTAAAATPVATPIALREALGRLERLAASNR
jgi:hypothetical protein